MAIGADYSEVFLAIILCYSVDVVNFKWNLTGFDIFLLPATQATFITRLFFQIML